MFFISRKYTLLHSVLYYFKLHCRRIVNCLTHIFPLDSFIANYFSLAHFRSVFWAIPRVCPSRNAVPYSGSGSPALRFTPVRKGLGAKRRLCFLSLSRGCYEIGKFILGGHLSRFLKKKNRAKWDVSLNLPRAEAPGSYI